VLRSEERNSLNSNTPVSLLEPRRLRLQVWN